MRYFATLLLFILWAAVVIVMTSCKSSPDMVEGQPAACYDALYCIYLCDDGDKSVCSDYVKACSNTRIYRECKEDDNFQSCWDKLQ